MTPDTSLALPVLTVEQLAPQLNCEPETVRAQALAGKLPGIKFGRDWVFPIAALVDVLNKRAIAEAEARSKPAKPVAIAVNTRSTKRQPPVLPTLPTDERPGPRLAATRTEAPSGSRSNP